MKPSVKTAISFGVFVTTFFVLYFGLSLVGVMFGQEYTEVIGSIPWFFIYSMFGSVISGVFASEVHDDL